MLGYSAKVLDILPDKLWCSMVVVEDGKNSIEKDMVRLPYPYVQGEQRVHKREHEQMQLLLKEGLYRSQNSISRSRNLRFARWRRWQVRIEQLLPLAWREI